MTAVEQYFNSIANKKGTAELPTPIGMTEKVLYNIADAVSMGSSLWHPLEFQTFFKDIANDPNAIKASKFVWTLNYGPLDYYKAKKILFEHQDMKFPAGGCTSMAFNGFLFRHFDWTYSRSQTFIVNTPAGNGKHAVQGTVSGYTALGHNSFADEQSDTNWYHGIWDNDSLYDLLPFIIQDGYNDAGLAISEHVVTAEYGHPIPSWELEPERFEGIDISKFVAGETTCMSTTMIPRYILDNFASIDELLDSHVFEYIGHNFYTPVHLTRMNYELQFLITDRTGDAIVLEFIDDGSGEGALPVIIKVGGNTKYAPVLTNFYIYGTEPDDLGYMILNRDRSGVNTSGITKYGMGVERYNEAVNLAHKYARDYTTKRIGYRSLLQKVYDEMREKCDYTLSYRPSDFLVLDDFWFTEYTGVEGLDITSAIEDYVPVIYKAEEYFGKRTRDAGSKYSGTWQTVHSVAFDLKTYYSLLAGQIHSEDEYSLQPVNLEEEERVWPGILFANDAIGVVEFEYDGDTITCNMTPYDMALMLEFGKPVKIAINVKDFGTLFTNNFAYNYINPTADMPGIIIYPGVSDLRPILGHALRNDWRLG